MGGTALLEREGPEDAGAAPPRRVVAEGNEGRHVETASAVGGLDREAQALGGQHRGEVEEGSADGCDGDPTPLGAMSGANSRVRWMTIPGRRREPQPGTRTWIEETSRSINSQSSAALRWLRTASAPAARTAAIQTTFAGDTRMADGVDAEVDAVQPPGLQ